MTKIFVSHSSHDVAIALKMTKDLEHRGLEIWISERDIKVGERSIKALETAMDASISMLLLVSQASMASGWVEAEYHTAMTFLMERPKYRLYPILLEDATRPLFLRNIQYMDLRNMHEYNVNIGKLGKIILENS